MRASAQGIVRPEIKMDDGDPCWPAFQQLLSSPSGKLAGWTGERELPGETPTLRKKECAT
jgi:hypothetical protein